MNPALPPLPHSPVPPLPPDMLSADPGIEPHFNRLLDPHSHAALLALATELTPGFEPPRRSPLDQVLASHAAIPVSVNPEGFNPPAYAAFRSELTLSSPPSRRCTRSGLRTLGGRIPPPVSSMNRDRRWQRSDGAVHCLSYDLCIRFLYASFVYF